MIVTCPSCSARYLVDAPKFGAAERRVRCARCGHVWLQMPVDDEIPPEDRESGEAPGGGAVPVRFQPPGAASPPAETIPPTEAPLPVIPPPPVAPEAPVESPRFAATRPSPDPVPDPPRRSGEEPVLPVPPRLRRRRELPPQEDPAPRDEMPRPRPWLDIPMLEPDDAFAVLEPKPAPRGWLRSAVWAGAALVVVALGVGGVAARDRVMDLWPSAARFYEFIGFHVAEPDAGLDIRKVTPTREVDNGLPTLVIAGEVANISTVARPVPKLKVMLRDSSDHDLQSWTFSATDQPLAPGATVPFRTSVTQPPDLATGVVVTFAGGEPRG